MIENSKTNPTLTGTSDNDLNCKLKNLAVQERSLTQEILEHVAEIDRRKLYLKMSFPSLFEYMTREIGYSAGAAQRRIDGARLIQKIPEVSGEIKSGSINLSQISKMQRICRQVKKESGSSVEVEIQRQVIEKLKNQGSADTDLILAQEFQIKIETQEKKQIQRDESVRIELTFSKEEMELIKKAQELLSHQTGGGLKNTLVKMAEKVIKESQPKCAISQSHQVKINQGTVNQGTNSQPEVKSGATVTVDIHSSSQSSSTAPKKAGLKTVTPRLRREIFGRDQCCQFKNPQTGRVCGSRHFLEVDHVRPKFVDGPNTPDNLRIYCSVHNKYRYQQGVGKF